MVKSADNVVLCISKTKGSPAIIRLGLSFYRHGEGPWPLITASQEVPVPSLGHPHSPCFTRFYGARGSLVILFSKRKHHQQ